MTLSGEDFKKLLDAMLQAYNKSDLRQMVKFNLDKDLDEIIGGVTGAEIIFNLIQWAEARGKLEDLLNAVSQNRPDNLELQKTVNGLLNTYFLSAITSTLPSVKLQVNHIEPIWYP